MPRKYILVLILFCIMLNASGFLWKLFEPVLFYDEVTHFTTPFTLVLLLAEIIYRSGGDDEFFKTPCGPSLQALSSASSAALRARGPRAATSTVYSGARVRTPTGPASVKHFS
jgi:hypothetical protein